MSDALARIAEAAEREGGLYGGALLPPEARIAIAPWAPLCGDGFAPGLEAIFEGHLVHGGRRRLFAPAAPDAALLCGDWLYAQGLAWVAARDDVDAVAALSGLIALAARERAEEAGERFGLWAATARYLGERSCAEEYEAAIGALRSGRDAAALDELSAGPAFAAARAAAEAVLGPAVSR